MDVGTIVGVVAILISLAIAYYSRRVKRLERETVSSGDILADGASTVKDLAVVYQGTELKNPRLVTVRLSNTGRVEIKADDFAKPITLSTDPGTNIISASVVERKPVNLDVDVNVPMGPTYTDDTVRIDANQAVIDPVLLNKRDSFSVQLLIDGPGGVGVSTRIAGAVLRDREDPRLRRRENRLFWARTSVFMLPVFACLLGLLVYSIIHAPHEARHAPNLIGQQYGEVPVGGDEVFQIMTHVVDSSQPAGTIVDEDPSGGDDLQENHSVTLYISSGKPATNK